MAAQYPQAHRFRNALGTNIAARKPRPTAPAMPWELTWPEADPGPQILPWPENQHGRTAAPGPTNPAMPWEHTWPPGSPGPTSPAMPQEPSWCCLCWRGDLVLERHNDLPPGRSGHQLADTNVVDSKWHLLTSSTVLYSLGLRRNFLLLTPWARRYWLSGEEEEGAYLSVQGDIFRPPGPNYPHRWPPK